MANYEIKQLREQMSKEGIDYYIVPTSDFHNSEYVSDYFKKREYLTGFTGSNGTVLVGKQEAILWTDGRYFIQAEKELSGSEVILYKMGEPDVKTMEEYLGEHLLAGQVLGFDGRVLDTKTGETFAAIATTNNAKICFTKDLVCSIWYNIPQMPANKLFLMPEKYCGKTVEEKLQQLRDKLKAKSCRWICS
jgi:Xaa-Pro aminopeptidase